MVGEHTIQTETQQQFPCLSNFSPLFQKMARAQSLSHWQEEVDNGNEWMELPEPEPKSPPARVSDEEEYSPGTDYGSSPGSDYAPSWAGSDDDESDVDVHGREPRPQPRPPQPSNQDEGKEQDDQQDEDQPDDQVHLRCGPSGPEWVIDELSLPCPCGHLIKRKRLARHMGTCAIQPCPLRHVRSAAKRVVCVKRIDQKRAECPACRKAIKASDKEVSLAKAQARHFSKAHREMPSTERAEVGRTIFKKVNVLVARTVSAALQLQIPLQSEEYEATKHERQRHGGRQPQTSQTTEEEELLRKSMGSHPEPQELFLVDALFVRQERPAKSTMSTLRSFEKALGLKLTDWRQLIAVAGHRSRAREVLTDIYRRSADLGYVTSHSVRRYLDFITGHLAETHDGHQWRPLVLSFKDLIISVMKENRWRVEEARGRRERNHVTEKRLDYPTRVRIERAATKKLTEEMKTPLPTDQKRLRQKAVYVRQAAYVALCVNQAHRTGVYQNLTCDEFQKPAETPTGLTVIHIGGKTRKRYRTVEVPVKKRLHRIISWYVEHLRPTLLRKADDATLFPYLNTWDPKLLDLKIQDIQDIDYPNIMRGNHSRRHHVQLGHGMHDDGHLKGTNVSELASLRCHSYQTATSRYDWRNKAVRASRADKAYRQSANRLYGIDEETSEEENESPTQSDDADMMDDIAATLPTTSGRKRRYTDVYTFSSSDEAGPSRQSPPPEEALQSREPSPPPEEQLPSREPSPPSEPRQGQLSLHDREELTGLLVDEEVLPFVRSEEMKDVGHSRTGKAWSLVERATVQLAISKKLMGKVSGSTKEERIQHFLESRPGWNILRRGVKVFLAQVYKCRE